MTARRSTRPRRRELRRGLVVTEGRTEAQYLDLLKAELRETVKVHVKVVSAGGEPRRVLEKARSLIDEARRRDTDYDWCCIVVDVDDHGALESVIRDAGDILVVVSNPCIELWLVWHDSDFGQHVTPGDLVGEVARRSLCQGKKLAPTFPVTAHSAAAARAHRADPDLGFGRAVPTRRPPCQRSSS